MRPLGIATWILAAMALFILWGAARADFSLLPESAKSSLDRCYRRCEKNNPPLPSPVPTHSPKPLPCEPIGGVKTFAEGEHLFWSVTKGHQLDVGARDAAHVVGAVERHGQPAVHLGTRDARRRG